MQNTVTYNHYMNHTCIKSCMSTLLYIEIITLSTYSSDPADPLSPDQRFEVPTNDVKRAELVRLSWQTKHNVGYAVDFTSLEDWGKICC